jgi:hypothetical protein
MPARLTTALLQAKRIPEATGAKARNAGVYLPKSFNKHRKRSTSPTTNMEMLRQILELTSKSFNELRNPSTKSSTKSAEKQKKRRNRENKEKR